MSLARVNSSVFAARKGATIKCEVDGAPIAKGERYLWFKVGFRARYKHVRCTKPEHYPKPSALESSMLADAYSAVEDAESELATLAAGDPEDDTSNIVQALETAAEGVRGVAEQYSEAMEAMGAAGEGGDMEERKDNLESTADELESYSPDNTEPDYDGCENEEHDLGPDDPKGGLERGDTANCEECAQIKADWWSNEISTAQDALSEVQIG